MGQLFQCDPGTALLMQKVGHGRTNETVHEQSEQTVVRSRISLDDGAGPQVQRLI